MRFENQLISLFALLFSIFLFGIGIVLLTIPYVSQLQQMLITLIQEEPQVFSKWGIGILASAGILVVLFWLLSKKRYLVVKMGGFTVYQGVLTETAQNVLQSFFPKERCQCEVVIRNKRKIEIFAHLPFVEKDNREKFLEEIEFKLTSTLAYLCGWKQEFKFHVCFQVGEKS